MRSMLSQPSGVNPNAADDLAEDDGFALRG
jgi:hypothetical protein